MPIPKITTDCINAIMEKATQQAPEVFVMMTLLKMSETQEDLSAAIAVISRQLSEAISGGDEELQFTVQVMMTTMACTMYEFINTTLEAKELEEQWS